jgi:hypothetical protein
MQANQVEQIFWLLTHLVGSAAAAQIYRLKGRSAFAGFSLAFIAGPFGLLFAIFTRPLDEGPTGDDPANPKVEAIGY